MALLASHLEERFAGCIRGRADMHAYQGEGEAGAVRFLYDNPFSAIFMDTGLGKTVSCGTLIDRLLTETFLSTIDYKVLIVAPIRVAVQTWPTEFTEWSHLCMWDHSLIRAEDDDPEVISAGREAAAAARADPATWERARLNSREAWYWATTGQECAKATTRHQFNRLIQQAAGRARTAAKEKIRRTAAASRAPIHIIDRGHLEWLLDLHSEVKYVGPRRLKKWKVKTWPYKAVIWDESSALKDYTTGTFKAMNTIRNHIERFHELTATPASETYLHLFPQIYLLDRGERLGRTVTGYRGKYFYQPPNRRFTYRLNPGADEKIAEKISDITLVMKSGDYLDEEEPLFLPRKLRLEPWQKGIYDQMQQDMIVKIDDEIIEAHNGGDLAGKLCQLSSGAIYTTKPAYKVIHDHKIEDLKQLAEELAVSGEPLMVCYWYKPNLARLKKAFPHATVMDKAGKAVPKWNRGEIPMLLVHPASMGHGLNMQKGPGHDVYFFDLCWSFELYYQTYRRLHRQGQKKRVRVHLPQMLGTADVVVAARLREKEDAQEALFQWIMSLRRAANDNGKKRKLQHAA